MKDKAKISKRIIAVLIDVVFLTIMLLVNGAMCYFLKVLKPYDIISYILILLISFIFNNAYLQGFHGFTIGKAFMKIKTVNAQGRYIGIATSFLREMLKFSWVFTLFLGFLSAVKDKNNRCWHDKIFDSYVIKEEFNNIFCAELMRPVHKKYVRYFKEYDYDNHTFLGEVNSIRDAKSCYKVYIDQDGMIVKYGYFVETELISYTRFVYQDYITIVYDFDSDGTFKGGTKYIFDKAGNIKDEIYINKKQYNENIA